MKKTSKRLFRKKRHRANSLPEDMQDPFSLPITVDNVRWRNSVADAVITQDHPRSSKLQEAVQRKVRGPVDLRISLDFKEETQGSKIRVNMDILRDVCTACSNRGLYWRVFRLPFAKSHAHLAICSRNILAFPLESIGLCEDETEFGGFIALRVLPMRIDIRIQVNRTNEAQTVDLTDIEYIEVCNEDKWFQGEYEIVIMLRDSNSIHVEFESDRLLQQCMKITEESFVSVQFKKDTDREDPRSKDIKATLRTLNRSVSQITIVDEDDAGLCFHRGWVLLGEPSLEALNFEKRVYIMLFPHRLLVFDQNEIRYPQFVLYIDLHSGFEPLRESGSLWAEVFDDVYNCIFVVNEVYIFKAPFEFERKKWHDAFRFSTDIDVIEAIGISGDFSYKEFSPRTFSVLDTDEDTKEEDGFDILPYIHKHVCNRAEWVVSMQPTVEDWIIKSSILFSNRGESTRKIDGYLNRYNISFENAVSLLRKCLIICEDSVRADALNHNVISFSYPGFGTEVFVVGLYSIVRANRIFPMHASSKNYMAMYTEEQWRNSLDSRSIGKELMQSMPDMTQIFENDFQKGKKLMSNHALNHLQDLHLVDFYRTNIDDFLSKQMKSFEWTDILSEESPNYEKLLELPNFTFRFNPDIFTVHSEMTKSRGGFRNASNPTLILCTESYWFRLFSLCQQYRYNALHDLMEVLDWYIDYRGVKSRRINSIIQLKSTVQAEMVLLKEGLDSVPKKYEALS